MTSNGDVVENRHALEAEDNNKPGLNGAADSWQVKIVPRNEIEAQQNGHKSTGDR